MAVGDLYSGNALVKPMSVQDYDSENLLMQAKRQGIQQNSLALQEGQQKLQQTQNMMAQRNALTGAIQSGQIDLTNPAHQQAALAMAPDVAPAMLKTIQDTATSAALAQKDAGAGASSQQEARTKAFALHRDMLPLVGGSQQGVQGWIQGLYADPATRDAAMQLSPDPQAALARVPAGGPELQAFVQQNAAGMDKFMSDQTQRRGQDVTAADSAANNRTTLAATAMNNATSRANNAAGIAKDYKVAGLDANGNFNLSALGGAPPAPVAAGAPGTPVAAGTPPAGNPIAGLVDSIGKYVAPEGVALQRVPPALKGAVLAQVMEKYPDYNAANYGGINKTVGAMATGPLGNMTRSINVVQTHVDTLAKLYQAMDNGNVPLVNQLKNTWQQQTGQPAPGNLDAARQLVGGEIASVVAAGGATLSDRQTAEASLDKASSPAQFAGVLNSVIQPLMAGKMQGIEQQYNAGTAGTRSDFRTKYLSPASKAALDAVSPAQTSSAHPPEITDLLKKYAPGK